MFSSWVNYDPVSRRWTTIVCSSHKAGSAHLLAGSVEVRVEDLDDVGEGDDLSPRGLASHTKGDLAILPTIEQE